MDIFSISSIKSILYLFAPFLIICYFFLHSLINNNLKGLVLLLGLFISTITTVLIGNGLVSKNQNMFGDSNELCNLVTINSIANISSVPLSLTVYCFVAFYMLYSLIVNNYFQQNFYIFLFFGLLILGDISWLKSNNCFKTLNIAVGFVISSLLGLLWGVFINKSNNKDLQYFTGEGKSCSIPARKTFKCKKRVLG